MAGVLSGPSSWWNRMLYDSFSNFLTGFGGWKDRIVHQHWAFTQLNPEQLENAFRSDWIARKIIQLPAFDSCRAWRQWQADPDQIEKLEAAEKDFALQLKLLNAIEKSRLYGGACLILGVNQGRFNEELDIEAVGKGDLKFVHVVEKWMINAGPRVLDITSPWYGEPSYYLRSNTLTPDPPGDVENVAKQTELGYTPGEAIFIHPSRVIRLIGLEYPDIERAQDAWGDSVLQPVSEAIKSAGLISSAIVNVIADMKLDVIKVPGLTAKMATDLSTTQVIKRFTETNAAKSVLNALLIDKEEEWERLQVQVSGMDKLLESYMTICAGAADIPVTRLIGRSPAGLNSTGESDIRNYYDKLASEQVVRLTPTISRLDEILIRHVFGERDPDIHYDWKPLWQMDEKDKAVIAFQKAQAYKIDVDTGLINPDALRIGRENQLIEDGFYPGFEQALEDADKKGDPGPWTEEETPPLLPHQMERHEAETDLIKAKAKALVAPDEPDGGGGPPNGGEKSDAYDPAEERDPHGRWSGGGGQLEGLKEGERIKIGNVNVWKEQGRWWTQHEPTPGNFGGVEFSKTAARAAAKIASLNRGESLRTRELSHKSPEESGRSFGLEPRPPGSHNPFTKGTGAYWGYEQAAAKAWGAEQHRLKGTDPEANTPKGPVSFGTNAYLARAAGGTKRTKRDADEEDE